MFALRSLPLQWRHSLALVTNFCTGAEVEAEKSEPLEPPKPEEPKPEPLQPEPTEPAKVLPLEKPKRRKPSPESYAHLSKTSIEKGKKTDKAILDVLFDWEKNSKARWGTIVNIQESLALRGVRLSTDTIRDHVTALAQAGSLCIERQVLDPKHTYVSGKSKIVKYLYTYLVALNGDNGERGIVDFVIRYFCEDYIERDEKGHFLGLC